MSSSEPQPSPSLDDITVVAAADPAADLPTHPGPPPEDAGQPAALPVPSAEEGSSGLDLSGRFRYKPRGNLFESKLLRLIALTLLLVLCGVGILAKVQRQTGTSEMLIGMALAVLPVPLLLGAFYWLDRVEPKPLRNLLFCFAWGSCAATLVAFVANTWATDLLISHQIGGDGQTLGATLVAPLVEESVKGSAILLLFLFRRKDFSGIVDGVVYAGFTATGFAFTENILYLGRSVLEGRTEGEGIAFTIETFITREVMSPFAHPLFTSMTGVGFGIAAMTSKRWLRILAPICGWIVAMFMHGSWNGSSALGGLGFLGVYFLFMVPVFGLMVWLVVWSRRNELRAVGRQLPVYAGAGWISPPVPLVLSSMRTRRQAVDLARFNQGQVGAKQMRDYLGFATSLAFLRQRAERGLVGAEFPEREQELLHHLWERKEAVTGAIAQVGALEWQRLHPPLRPFHGYARPPGAGFPPPQYPGPGYRGPQYPGQYPGAFPGAHPAPGRGPYPVGYPGAYPPAGYQQPPAYLPAQPQPGTGYQAPPQPYPQQPFPQQPAPQPHHPYYPYQPQPHHPTHHHPAPPQSAAPAAPAPDPGPPAPPPHHHH